MSVAAWLLDVPVTAVEVAVLALLIVLLERFLLRRSGGGVREVLWSVVLLRLLLPARWFALPVELPWAGANAVGGVAGAAWPWLLSWAAGAVACAGFGFRRYRRTTAALAAAAVPAAPEWTQACAEAAARLGLGTLPAVRATADRAAPCLVGLRRPVVFVPCTTAVPLDHAQRMHIALHELAHLRRRDPWRALAVLVVQIAFFWHPVVWLAARRLRSARELGADALAVAAALDARAYGHTLLRCARSSPPRLPTLFASMASGDLRRRIEAIVTPGRTPRRQVLAVLLLLVAASLAAAASVVPVARTPGCLLLRYQVLSALADEPLAAR